MRGLICPRFLRPSGDELAAIAELRMRETMKGDPASRMKENARPIVNADRCPKCRALKIRRAVLRHRTQPCFASWAPVLEVAWPCVPTAQPRRRRPV